MPGSMRMEPVHVLVAAAVAILAAAAGVLALSGSSRAWLVELAGRRIAPPAWVLLAGVVLVALALGVVVLRALGRGDDRTAILAVVALAVNQLTLVLGVNGRRPRVAMAGFLVFAAAVLAVAVSAEWGRATVAAAVGCAVWVAVNLAWTARLAYSPYGGVPAEAEAHEARPPEARPAQAQPPQAQPPQARSAEARPAQAQPAEARPAQKPPRKPGRHRRRSGGPADRGRR